MNATTPTCREKRLHTIDLIKALVLVGEAAEESRCEAKRLCMNRDWRRFHIERRNRERLYEFRDRGIVEALKKERIAFMKLRGGLAVYAGEGHIFLSTLLVDGPLAPSPNESWKFSDTVDARQRSFRLTDAIGTLEQLPKAEGFRRLPSRATSKRSRRNSA